MMLAATLVCLLLQNLQALQTPLPNRRRDKVLMVAVVFVLVVHSLLILIASG